MCKHVLALKLWVGDGSRFNITFVDLCGLGLGVLISDPLALSLDLQSGSFEVHNVFAICISEAPACTPGSPGVSRGSWWNFHGFTMGITQRLPRSPRTDDGKKLLKQTVLEAGPTEMGMAGIWKDVVSLKSLKMHGIQHGMAWDGINILLV